MTNQTYLEQYANLVKDVAEKIFLRTAKIQFTQPASLEKKNIVEYDHKMLANGLEKFNGPAYVSAVSFFRTTKDKETGKACGTLIVNVPEKDIGKTMEAAGYPKFDDDDQQEVIAKCNDLCVQIAKTFIDSVAGGIIVSDPIGNRNSIAQGVNFSYDQYEKYDICFYTKTGKFLVIELTIVSLQ